MCIELAYTVLQYHDHITHTVAICTIGKSWHIIVVGAGPASPVLAGPLLIIDWPGKPQVIENLHAKHSMQKAEKAIG